MKKYVRRNVLSIASLIIALLSFIALISFFYGTPCPCDNISYKLYTWNSLYGSWVGLLLVISLASFLLIKRFTLYIVTPLILLLWAMFFAGFFSVNYPFVSCKDQVKVHDLNSIQASLRIYQEAHQEYPESLNQLLPDYIASIPSHINGYEKRGNSYRVWTTLMCNVDYPGDLRPNDPVFEIGPLK